MSDMNGRQDSEAPSSSNGSDFYNIDAHDAGQSVAPGTTTIVSKEDEIPTRPSHDPDDADDEDSSSEMDFSASSRASSTEPGDVALPHAGIKRKLTDGPEDSSTLAATIAVKKRKLPTPPPPEPRKESPGFAGLPGELWQQVLLHLPPAMLCRCLRVCRTFHTYLTDTKADSAAKKDQAKVRVLDSEAIWIHARKLFFPNLPRPLERCSELEMLQLVGGRSCQICFKPPVPSPCTTPFNCGPGHVGQRVFWPFGVRACGNCITGITLRDVQILVTPAANLRFGLPYAFLTPDLHFVSETQRQAPGGIPQHLRVSKVYYDKDIEAICSAFDEANSLGEGAADEWRKGLHQRGKDIMADAARWEKWESQLRLGTDLSQVLREYDPSSFTVRLDEAQRRSAGSFGSQPPTVTNGTHMLPQPVHAFQHGYPAPYPVPNLQYQQAHRPVRDPHEVEAVRQQRKLDIERRCLELDPPLSPSVLQYIDSFQATMQITAPMTDSAWEMLRPRLLAKREAAEQLEHERQAQLAALQATVPSSSADEPFMKTAKEVYDKDYELAQDPLRLRLGEYADEYIQNQWNGATGLDKDNCPSFAVETMLHVRQRYLSDKEAGNLPAPGGPAKTTSKQGTPVPEPFLSLDNMKWVWDNRIRPLTDVHHREIFICAGCEDRKPKWFAFEGLIQHYGAKHTTSFSRGNIVVQWQTSEWPDDPPFHQHPSSFIKPDRRTSEMRHHGRSRNTPQVSHSGPFAPPTPGKLLSESPLFSTHSQQSAPAPNGFHHGPPGYQPQAYGHGSPPMAQYGHHYGQPAFPEPAFDPAAQVNKLAGDARQVWDSLEGVKDLLECIRMQAVIHHTVTMFESKFRSKPSLDLVTDALATGGDQVKPIKNAAGLACKSCVSNQKDGAANYQSYFARIRNVKLRNFSSLVTHFKILHPEQDWTSEMVEVPELQIISDLIRAPGMDDDKLSVLAEAFKSAFPSPLPRIGSVLEPLQDTGPASGLANRLLDRLNKKPKQQQNVKKKGANGFNTPGRDKSQEPLPEPKEDEYDPRRPMFVRNEEQSADPGRFDTDISRRTVSVPEQSMPHGLNLAPETLAALTSLSTLASSQHDQGDSERAERSPSVGRAESTRPAAKVEEETSKVAPDITAILASLTGLAPTAQNAIPTPSIMNRPESATKYAQLEPYGRPPSTTHSHHQVERQPITRYVSQPSYASPVEPPAPRYDTQAVHASPSTRNRESFDHNRANIFAETGYAPASQHLQQSPPRSPPRPKYVYEDNRQPYQYQQHQAPPQQQQQQYTPLYREQQPQQAIQYIQLPPQQNRHASLAAYQQYEQRSASHQHQSKPVYLDEYGRQIELIPIDSAPAPVQYLPHPFEHHHQPSSHRQQQYYTQPAQQPVYYEYSGYPTPSTTTMAPGMGAGGSSGYGV